LVSSDLLEAPITTIKRKGRGFQSGGRRIDTLEMKKSWTASHPSEPGLIINYYIGVSFLDQRGDGVHGSAFEKLNSGDDSTTGKALKCTYIGKRTTTCHVAEPDSKV